MTWVSEKVLRIVLVSASCLLFIPRICLGQSSNGAGRESDHFQPKQRWFFSFGYGRQRQDVETIKSLIDIGADHGLNGMVLSSFDLDGITSWNEKDIALLQELAAYGEQKQIELIPTGFSVGYGGGALGHDPNLAAALPVRILLKAGEGKILPEWGEDLLINGDLEEHTQHRFSGYAFHDQPGQVSFADTVAASGRTAIRFENFDANPHGHGRIMQTIRVKPGHVYRFSCKLKTRDLSPVTGLKAMVLAKGRSLADVTPNVKFTQDWTDVTLDYINTREEEISLYAGIWGGKSGTFWLDDLHFREYGTLSDIVRREGTPLELKSRDRDVVFLEGRDFAAIRCLRELDHVSLLPGSSIREGEALEISCYKIPYVGHAWGRQISLCMSNPKLYEYWEAQARRLRQVIPFKRFLLSMDEIRNGGGCLLCRNRRLSMAEILGDCITRQRAIFKAIDPSIEVLIWSDMLDPAHNAHDNYYGVVGDFTDSWKYVPQDLTMVCWYYDIRNESLRFFSSHGFRTLGAAYYDADDLTNPRQWLVSLRKTPHAQGIMYTTWERKYSLLGEFGDLVTKNASESGDAEGPSQAIGDHP
jgi:hypothetical protein